MKLQLALPVGFLLGLFCHAQALAQSTNSIPKQLRSASFACDKATIDASLELKRAGWTYIMPEPKSAQAMWGNRDGRTTWWVGYWVNGNDHTISSGQPKKDNGKLVGDGNGGRAWRRGGSPRRPSKIEWLCSKGGGIEPR